MYKFRKKPIEIEAFQMTKERRTDNSAWPEWLNKAWNYGENEIGAVSVRDYPNSDGTDPLVINTLEGKMLVGWGDWIIRGIKGELYPCKADIFEATYDPVDQPPTALKEQSEIGGNHPIQPLGVDPTGVIRFKSNAIVQYLLKEGPFYLNHIIASKQFSIEDRVQFAQLIGYSLSGFGKLSCVSNSDYEAAERQFTHRNQYENA